MNYPKVHLLKCRTEPMLQSADYAGFGGSTRREVSSMVASMNLLAIWTPFFPIEEEKRHRNKSRIDNICNLLISFWRRR